MPGRLLALQLALWRWLFGRLAFSLHTAQAAPFIPPAQRYSRRKPPWVRHELIRLRAWSPELGCRKWADVFNRRFADRGISVSKSHIAEVLRRATVEIMRLRRDGKHRVLRPMPLHRVWAMDLTGKVDLTGRQHLMSGLLDHGSRACLRLSALTDKRTIIILHELIIAFRRFGIPQRIRVDNEACFNSRLMKAAEMALDTLTVTTK